MVTILIFDHVTLIGFLICCSIPNFIKIGSRVRLADAHTCYMFNAQLLGNRRLHSNRITTDTSERDGMRPHKFRPNRFIARRVMAFPIFSNMAAVRYLEF